MSPAKTSEDPLTFLVVTPSRNAARYLDEAISSVVLQRGEFRIRYHIQDALSQDGTPEIIAAWRERLRGTDMFFRGANPIELSFDSRDDGSMYEAIQRGFEMLTAGRSACPDRTIMTWINADDRIAPDAFRTVAAFFERYTEERWVTGIAALLREDGVLADLRLDDWGYSRARLARGEHDGRHAPFVMQEGTFWRMTLWTAVRGLDARFRLAGDWDLWRRMAHHSRLVTLRAVLAHHRRRRGQLSENLTNYWAEVDDRRALPPLKPDANPSSTSTDENMESAWVAAWRADLDDWSIFPRVPKSVAAAIRKRRESLGWTREQLAARTRDGMSAEALKEIESGNLSPDIDGLRTLSRIFKCNVIDLLPPRDKKPRQSSD